MWWISSSPCLFLSLTIIILPSLASGLCHEHLTIPCGMVNRSHYRQVNCAQIVIARGFICKLPSCRYVSAFDSIRPRSWPYRTAPVHSHVSDRDVSRVPVADAETQRHIWNRWSRPLNRCRYIWRHVNVQRLATINELLALLSVEHRGRSSREPCTRGVSALLLCALLLHARGVISLHDVARCTFLPIRRWCIYTFSSSDT